DFLAAPHQVEVEVVSAPVLVDSRSVSRANLGRTGDPADDYRPDRCRSEFGPERLIGVPFDPAGNEGIDERLLPSTEPVAVRKGGGREADRRICPAGFPLRFREALSTPLNVCVSRTVEGVVRATPG